MTKFGGQVSSPWGLRGIEEAATGGTVGGPVGRKGSRRLVVAAARMIVVQRKGFFWAGVT